MFRLPNFDIVELCEAGAAWSSGNLLKIAIFNTQSNKTLGKRYLYETISSISGNKIRNISPTLLQMEQVLHSVWGVMGDGGIDAREPCEEEQYDGKPPASRHRRVQVLRG